MTNFILFVLLIVQLAQLFLIKKWLDLNDFSKEDASVKATTDAVEKAKERLPKQET